MGAVTWKAYLAEAGVERVADLPKADREAVVEMFVEMDAPQSVLWEALFGDVADARALIANKLKGIPATSSRPLDRIDLIVALRLFGLEHACVDQTDAMYKKLRATKVYDFQQNHAALVALGLGRFKDVVHFKKAAKPPARFKSSATFRDFAQFLGWFTVACRDGASVDDVTPGWEAFVDALPMWATVSRDVNVVLALIYVARAYVVFVLKRPESEALDFVHDAIAARRSTAVAKPKPIAKTDIVATRLRDALDRDGLEWNLDRRYGVVTLNGRITRTVDTGVLATAVLGPATTRSHLVLAAARLEAELKPLKRLDSDRARHTAPAFSMLGLIHAAGAAPIGRSSHAWIDAVCAYRGPIEDAHVRTAALAALALRGEAGIAAFEATTFWGKKGSFKAGKGPVAALRGAIVKNNAKAAEAALDEHLAELTTEEDLRDLVWFAWAAVVRGMGRQPGEIMDVVHARVTALRGSKAAETVFGRSG